MNLICNFRVRLIAIYVVVLILSSCNDRETHKFYPPPPIDTGDIILNSLEGKLGYFTTKTGYKTSFNKVIELNESEILILGETSETQQYGTSKGFMATINKENDICTSFTKQDGGFFDACIHPSGEYTVGKFVRSDTDQSEYYIVFQRYSNSGELLREQRFIDPNNESYYNISFSDIWDQTPFTIENSQSPDTTIGDVMWYRFGIMDIHAYGEDIVFAYNLWGQKVSYLSSNLDIQWAKTLMIADFYTSGRATSMSPKITIDSQNNIHTVTTLYNDAIPAYNHRFGKNLSPNTDKQYDSDLVLKTLSIQGDLITEKHFGTNESDLIAAIGIHDNKLVIGVNSRRNKSNSYSSSEWDIGLFSVDINSLEYTHNWLDIDNEDILTGISTYNNSLILYGMTGFKQVDTNSWVSHYNSFYGIYNPTTQTMDSPNIISIDRSTDIDCMIEGSDYIYGVGSTNKPITHSSDTSSTAILFEISL